MANSNNVPQTLKEQLFSGFTLVLWVLIVFLLVAGLAGTVSDLSEPFIFGQGLTRADALGFLIGGLVLAGALVAFTVFSPEYKARRRVS